MFQNLADVYEAMIDWPKRLDYESPFYRRLFEQHGVRSVVDTACGTGQHAGLFHTWGLRVEGADLSAGMIGRARKNFGEPPGLRWVERGFDQPIAPAEPFDAAVCVGNSLPLAPDRETVQRAIEQMLLALRCGGLLVVHALNLWRLPDGPCVWQKCRRATLSQTEAIIIKGVHRCGPRGYVDLIVVGPTASVSEMQMESVPFLGLETGDWESMARAAGAGEIRFLGGYEDQPYDRRKSVDLLIVARKL